ncbi:Phospholipase D1, partial [Entomortierella beljakovae]
LQVTDLELDIGAGNKITFRVELQYAEAKWVIRRTLNEFYKLHLLLVAKRYPNLPKFPDQVKFRSILSNVFWGMKLEDRVRYIRENSMQRRMLLQEYLANLLKALGSNSCYEVYELLEISTLSLSKDMGWKGKEGHVSVRVTERGKNFLGMERKSHWVKKWLILRDTYVACCDTIGSTEPYEVFFFDPTFFVQQKEGAMGMASNRIVFGNNIRKIEIKGSHSRDTIQWFFDFEKIRFYSPWITPHRFGSFSPEREDARVKMYIDGKDYFHAVADSILAAKNEIYICDWWLSPELYLRRPAEEYEEFRLDRLLKRKAMEGVQIYIVVYKEVTLALTLDSAHTKIWLQDLHPNIQVQRHPDHIGTTTTMFWAHHEKLCVIDGRLAFIGGLDLCFGRYDTHTHQLSDYHPSGTRTIWPGQDYNNPFIKDFTNGQPARDIARHFVQRWNFVKQEKGSKKLRYLFPKGEFVENKNDPNFKGTQKVQILRSSGKWSQGIETEASIQDAYISAILKAKHFVYIENQFFITLGSEGGNPEIKNKIGVAIVERILRAVREREKFRVIVVMPLMPSFEADLLAPEGGTLRKVMHFQYESICRGGHSIIERLFSHGINPFDYIGFFSLRSYDRIKHGKFDAIIEAIRDQENARSSSVGDSNLDLSKKDSRNNLEKSRNSADLSRLASVTSSEILTKKCKLKEQFNKIQTCAAGGPATDPVGSGRGGKSLAAKTLLDKIPKGTEAERLLEIAEDRKPMDDEITWDDSISSQAMNPPQQELGYVPANTSETLKDKELTERIARETDEAEHKAVESGYRKGGASSPELLDGLGTTIKNKVNDFVGYKSNGNLEPLHRRITNPLSMRSRGEDGSNDENDGASTSGGMTKAIKEKVRGITNQKKAKDIEEAIEDAEHIVEPGGGHSRKQGSIYSYVEDDEEEDDGDESSTPSTPVSSAFGDIFNTASTSTSTSISRSTSTSTSSLDKIPTTQTSGTRRRRNKRRHQPTKPVVDDDVDNFITEVLYIHSKLLIVDDRIVICGSGE